MSSACHLGLYPSSAPPSNATKTLKSRFLIRISSSLRGKILLSELPVCSIMSPVATRQLPHNRSTNLNALQYDINEGSNTFYRHLHILVQVSPKYHTSNHLSCISSHFTFMCHNEILNVNNVFSHSEIYSTHHLDALPIFLSCLLSEMASMIKGYKISSEYIKGLKLQDIIAHTYPSKTIYGLTFDNTVVNMKELFSIR